MPHISVVLRTRDLNVSRQVDKPLIYAETGKLRTLHIVSYCLGICNEWIFLSGSELYSFVHLW